MGKLQEELNTIKKQIAELTEAIKKNHEKEAKTTDETELVKLKSKNEQLLRQLEELQEELKKREENHANKEGNIFKQIKEFFLGEIEE